MNLYEVRHRRPVRIPATTARIALHEPTMVQPVIEDALVALVPLEKLTDVLRQIDSDSNVEVLPVGDSPEVCAYCQSAVATVDDMCADDAERLAYLETRQREVDSGRVAV